MLYILDRQERVIDILKNDGGADFSVPSFFDDILTEDLQTGAETFTFTTIDKGGVSKNLVAGNYIAFKKKGKYKLFQIMQIEESHEDVIYITVYCESAGLELINKVFRATKIASADQKKFLTTVLSDTGWNVGMVDATNEEAHAFDLEDSTVYATLQNNIGKFGVELEFRVEINGGRISQKFVDTYASRGKITGKRFTFGKDIEKLTRKVDTTSLFTALVGKGKDNLKFSDITVNGIDKPLGQDFVADQEAFNRYNNNGYHIMGIYEFDTNSPEELLRATYKQLQKCKEPKVEYEIEVAMLGELLGEDWNGVEIGDTVAITDTAFNPPITLMARVSKLETSFTNPQGDKCTLANFIEVSSNITDEMRKIASKLEGYVDNSISGKFPIGSDDIKEGAVLGKHIYKNSITTEHLQADSITVDKLDVNYVKAIDGEFKSLKTKNAEINQAIINNAQITKAEIDKLVAKDGEFEKIVSGKADIKTVTAIDGKISQLASIVITAEDLTAINGDIKNLKSKYANIEEVVAGKVSTEQLNVVNGDIKNLKSKYAEIDSIKTDIANINTVVAGKVSTEELNAVSGVVNKLKSDLIETNKLVSNKASIADLKSASAEIDKLKVKDGQFDNLLAGNLTASNMKANSITGDRLQAGTITADKIKAGTITAESGILGEACINTANIGDAQITGAKVAKGAIGTVNITDGAIISTKIAKAQITGAHIQKASIEDAHIKNINASKISAGVLDAKNITVKNLSADSITVGQINGKQIQAGAISKDKLDDALNGVIKNTIDNVDDALKNIGLVKQDIQGINSTVSKKADATLVENQLNQAKTDLKKYSDDVAKAKADLAQQNAIANADGKITAEEQKRIKQAQDNLNTAIAKANEVATQKANLAKQEAIRGARSIPDTRNDNQSPKWYMGNYPCQTITEFKTASNIGISGTTYGTLETKVPWNDASGGYPVQIFRSNNTPTYQRKGVNDTTWSEWEQLEDAKGAQTKANNALNDAKSYVDNSKKEIQNQIKNVTTIVNGKNTIFYSPTQPSASGRITNDIWFDIDNGYKMYKFANGNWVATQFGTDAIASNSITGEKILANSITSGKIASGSITSDKIGAFAITSDKIASNSITAGKVATNAITSQNIIAGAITTDKIASNSVTAEKINVEDLFVSGSAFMNNLEAVDIKAEQITTGKISGDVLDLTGLVNFEALDNTLQDNFVFDTTSNKTYINGGYIYTNSVTADKINAKGLTVTDKSNTTTLKIDDDGEVYVTGNMQSSNYDEVAKTGYKITKDGDMILNNALVRGDVVLPNAGMTNFGENYNNLIKNSGFFNNTEHWLNNGGTPTVEVKNGFSCLKSKGSIRHEEIQLQHDTSYIYWCEIMFDGDVEINGNTPLHHWCNTSGQSGDSAVLNGSVYEVLEGNGIAKANTWHKIALRFKTKTKAQFDKDIYFTPFIWKPNFPETFWLKNISLSEGEFLPRIWNPSNQDKLNHIRFWAGANFENRNNAPFKVFQDGTLYATKGNFEGTFSGSVDVGNIHITDTNTSQAVFKINTNNDSETKVFLSEEGSYFNTNVVFGTIDKKQVEVDVNNKKVNILNSTMKVKQDNKGWVEIGGTDASYSPLSLGFEKGTFGDYRHNVGFDGGALTFDNVGARGTDKSDYKFSKKSGAERVKVEIDGDLDVTDNVVLGVMKIARKNDAGNEGVDFII